MRVLLVTMGILLLNSSAATAQVTVKEYQAAVVSTDPIKVSVMKAHVRGLGEGIMWSNLQEIGTNKPFYCPPDKLAMRTANYMDVLDRKIAKDKETDIPTKLEEDPIVMLLILGLKETFPCNVK